ncbi:MAG TPA: carboxymuconolactone decarboxylase family protein [Actinomycetota bacterium]|nr:carboxymuconolactone decarboxylase family protein [Actinomycetota bacterium]
MARLTGVTEGNAGVVMKVLYRFMRRGMRALAGRSPERGLEPLEMFAVLPRLLRAYGRLEQATTKLGGTDRRTHALATLKAATLTQCEYCIDIGSAIARRWGLTDEEMVALPVHPTSDVFSAVDKLVLDYAAGMSRTPVQVPDELFAALCQHFSEAQIVELTHLIALENYRGRFNLALGIGAAGFSEGLVCAVPVGAGG